jgi:homocysteine S-methyltransferase
MDRPAFSTLLRHGPLLTDGGMGTSLVDAGAPVGGCFEALNAEDPGLVEKIHRSFVEAGAQVLITNTFGGSAFALGRHGLAHRVEELNRRGVEVARAAGGDEILVAGSAGPLRVRLAPYGRVRPAQAMEAYAEQIAALAQAGADLIAVETQSDLAEAEQAMLAARSVCDLPVIVTFTFARDDRTLMGHSPEQVAETLTGLGVDAMGVNCGEGPAQVLRTVTAMRPLAGETPLVARPNAGGPRQVGGRFLYPATPEYFAEHARSLLAEGVAVVGGCCGSKPAHIRAMAEAIRTPDAAAGTTATVIASPTQEAVEDEGSAPGELAAKLAEGRFVVAVEVDPPRGFSTAGTLAAAETLAEAGADVIDVADSPMARLRMSPWAVARLIQESVGIETVLHFPTRGRNLLRIQGDLLGIHALGIRNVFVVLGDPVVVGDYPGGTDNVDLSPSGLLRLITGSFNQGRDRSGASIGEPTSFVAGCAVNPNAPDLERECRVLRRKIEAGASFALTQPVFGPDPLLRLREVYERSHGELALPLLAGVLPVVSSRHAEFLHNEVPGMDVPEDVRRRLERAGPNAEGEGLRMASELATGMREVAQGLYLVPQFHRFDLSAEIVEAARKG